MSRFRISDPARDDLEHILSVSRERWGERGRARYASLLALAFRQIARTPDGVGHDRSELADGLRSLHIRQVRRANASVKDPAHVIFYRAGDVIEIVRVLHERMDPTLHLVTR